MDLDPQFSPQQEAATFTLLSSAGVSAPRLVAADPSGSSCDVPAILVTRAPGAPLADPLDLDPFARQLAEALMPVHAIDAGVAARTVPGYRPYYDRGDLLVPVWTRRPKLWERAIELATATAPVAESRFIHRDYHPGNTLWFDEHLTSIVDWTTASFGSPSVDLSHMRANLAMSFDLATADAFLVAHETVSASRVWHPYWDLRVAVDFLPDLTDRQDGDPRLARLETLVSRAVSEM
jgi:aminoglycoside phosphotransferase (APT) family kinase protein